MGSPASRRRAVLAVALGALGCWAYWPTLVQVSQAWASNPDYSHGFLVPLISLWILLRTAERDSLSRESQAVGVGPLIAIAVVVALRCTAARFYQPELDAWTIPLWIGAIVWLADGRPALLAAAPAIAFLWFAAPLPASIETIFGSTLQGIAASLSAATLRCFGQPAVAEGTLILLNDNPLDVERECSGLRMVYGIAALCAACLALIRPAKWKAACLLLAIAPIAIGANVVRVAATGALIDAWPSDEIARLVHTYAGVLVIPIATVAFLAALAGLSWIENEVRRSQRGRVIAFASIACAGLVALYFAASAGQSIAATRLRDAGDKQAAVGEWREAYESYRRYALLHQDNPEIQEKMGDLVSRHDPSVSGARLAYQHYWRVWRKDPSEVRVSMKTGTSALKAGMHREAVDVTSHLRNTNAHDPIARQALILRADALLVDFINSAALSTDESSATMSEKCRDALIAAASLADPEKRHVIPAAEDLRARASPEPHDPLAAKAERLLNRLIESEPKSPGAWIARYEHHTARAESVATSALDRHTTAARQDLERAVSLARGGEGPAACDALVIAAEAQLGSEKSSDARALLRDAINADPSDHRPYLMLADIAAKERGRSGLEAAAEILDQGTRNVGGLELALSIRLAATLAELQRFDRANATLAEVERVLDFVPEPQRSDIIIEIALVSSRLTQFRDGVDAAISDLLATTRQAAESAASSARVADLHQRLGLLSAMSGWHDAACQWLLQAAAVRPLDAEAEHALADSARLSGNLALSETLYRGLIERDAEDLRAAQGLLSVLMQQGKTASDTNIENGEIGALTQRAVETGLGGPAIPLLRAQRLLAEGDGQGAMEVLNAASEADPDDAALWRGFAVVRQRAGDNAGAIAAARQYAAVSKDRVNAILFQAQLLFSQGRLDEAKNIVRSIQLDDAKPYSQEAALLLAQIELVSSGADKAMETLDAELRRSPNALRLIDAKARLAATMNDWETLGLAVQRLRQIEGNAGAHWRFHEARRGLAAATSIVDPGFVVAQAHGRWLMRRRPQWAHSHSLQGEIDQRLGSHGAASERFADAWRLGERTPDVAIKMLDALFAQRRFGDAVAFLTRAQDLLATSPLLLDRAASLPLGEASHARLVSLAREWVKRQPNSAAAHLRLARTLSLTRSFTTGDVDGQAEAANAASRAIELAPTDTEVWLSAVFSQAGQASTVDDLLAFIDGMADAVPVSRITHGMVRARVLEAVGRRVDAAAQYNQTLELSDSLNPSSRFSEVATAASEYYAADSPYLADYWARKALDASPNDQKALVALVAAIAAGSASAQEGIDALRVLEPTSSTQTAAESRRLLAQLLLRRGDPGDMNAAIQELEAGVGLTRNDQLLLAKLHEEAGRSATALNLLIELADQPDATAEVHEALLGFWRRQMLGSLSGSLTGRVKTAYRALADADPTGKRWLRAQLRETRQRRGEIPGPAGADRIREALQLDGQANPSLLSGLIGVALQEDSAASVREFASNPPRGVSQKDAVMAWLLAIARGAHDGIAPSAFEGLSQFLSENLNDAELWHAAGDAYLVMGQNYSAIDAYRRVIGVESSRASAINNLAIALAEMGDNATALQRQREAAKLGADANAIDTLAWIRLRAGMPVESLRLLEQLNESAARSPVHWLHMAMAFDASEQTAEAIDALHKAIGLGAEEYPLIASERRFVERVKSEVTASRRERSARPPSHEKVARRTAAIQTKAQP